MEDEFNIDVFEFPLCISCNLSNDVDIKEIHNQTGIKKIFTCNNCGCKWDLE
jgi:hypothetical protein